MEIILTFTLWLIIGAGAAYWAQLKGRDPIAWFVIGMLLGIFSLIILYFLPVLDSKASPLGEEEEEVISDLPVFQDNRTLQDWYYLDNDNLQQGPLPFHKLQKLVDQKALSDNTLVWSDGMHEWTRVENLPELKAIR